MSGLQPAVVDDSATCAGSRRFRRWIDRGDWAAAWGHIADRGASGADGVDVGLLGDKRDELALWRTLVASAPSPLSTIWCDSLDPEVFATVLEAGLPAVLNSCNLADGGVRLDRTAHLALEYAAPVVFGCIDQTGPAIDRHSKLEVARRGVDRLMSTGVAPGQVVIDLVTLPRAREIGERPAWAETLAAVAMIRDAMPGVRVMVAISNLSHGLAPRDRAETESQAMVDCTAAEVDFVILHLARLGRDLARGREGRSAAVPAPVLPAATAAAPTGRVRWAVGAKGVKR